MNNNHVFFPVYQCFFLYDVSVVHRKIKRKKCKGSYNIYIYNAEKKSYSFHICRSFINIIKHVLLKEIVMCLKSVTKIMTINSTAGNLFALPPPTATATTVATNAATTVTANIVTTMSNTKTNI